MYAFRQIPRQTVAVIKLCTELCTNSRKVLVKFILSLPLSNNVSAFPSLAYTLANTM